MPAQNLPAFSRPLVMIPVFAIAVYLAVTEQISACILSMPWQSRHAAMRRSAS